MRRRQRQIRESRIGRFGRAAALLLAAGAALLAPIAAHGAADIRAAALKAGEAPAGFTNPHVLIYHAFTATMKAKVKGPAGSVDTICLVTGTSTRIGWVEGLVEGFDTTGIASHLRVCGVLLKNSTLTSAVYTDEAGNVNSHIKIGLETKLPSHVGAASVAGQSKHTYEVVFRKGNAVIELDYGTYSGKVIGSAAFLKLGTKMSSRIH